MKNQYFGDINDYRKYGLLRALTGNGTLRTAVCWMLTPDDGRRDGKRVSYLYYPLMWQHHDPELFNSLRETVLNKKTRDVREAEKTSLLHNACFHAAPVPDGAPEREEYFKSFMDIAQHSEVIFFDPDNGIEVPSMPFGWKGSSKYTYWREIITAFTSGHSVLVYQHFPRIRRDRFVPAIAQEFAARTGALSVYTFKTSCVLFLLACRRRHLESFQNAAVLAEKSWEPHFQITLHLYRH